MIKFIEDVISHIVANIAVDGFIPFWTSWLRPETVGLLINEVSYALGILLLCVCVLVGWIKRKSWLSMLNEKRQKKSSQISGNVSPPKHTPQKKDANVKEESVGVELTISAREAINVGIRLVKKITIARAEN